jgi:hypothetical protein
MADPARAEWLTSTRNTRILTMARVLTPRSASWGTKSSLMRAMTIRAYKKVATKTPTRLPTGPLRLASGARELALAN